MPRVSVTLPKDVYEKISKYSELNDESISNVVAKMAELGFMVKQNQDNKSGSGMSEIDEHCSKLMIQMNALVKEMAEKKLGYDKKMFDDIRDKAVDRFNDIVGYQPEEL